jgi:HEAT repeat protein
MPLWIRSRTLALVLALYAGGYALAIAQPESAPKQESAPRQQPAAPAAPTAEPAKPGTQEAPPEESPLLVEPKTPAEFFDAAVLTDKLYRPGLTKRYLEKLLQSNPSDDAILEMRSKYGPGIFLHLARDPALKPIAGQLLDRAAAVLQRREGDVTFLDSMIDGLNGSPSDRESSLQMLKSIGPTTIPRILTRLGSPKPGQESGVLVQALAQYGLPALPVLYGGLESTNDGTRNGAIQAIGLIGSRMSIPYLLDPAFDPNQPAGIRSAARTALARIMGIPTDRGDGVPSFGAARELKKLAKDYLANRVVWPTMEGRTDLWTWSEEAKSVVRNQVPPNVASLYTGLQFARQALSMAPEDRDAQILLLALEFAWDAEVPKEERPDQLALRSPIGREKESVHNLALTSGPDVASGTLALGESLGNPAIEIGALRALAAVGAREEIYGSRQSRSPLLTALNDPNTEVQYAAAVAILRASPDIPFRGAQRVVDILTRAISGSGSPVAVVIDANRLEGNEMAGLLNQLGFEPITAVTGREGFEAAVGRSNVVLVAVQTNAIRWPLSQTVANLRADARTAQIPILVFGPETVRPEIRGLLTHYPQVEFMVESTTPQAMQAQSGDFLKHALAMAAPPANRAERIADAAAWFAAIARANETKVFNLDNAESALMAISSDRQYFGSAIEALAAIPSGAVQRHLEQLAIGERLDPAIRELAARALAAHIQRHGLLLHTSQVAELESTWHTAQTPELSTALAAAVGSLKPNAKRVGDRLQRATTPNP